MSDRQDKQSNEQRLSDTYRDMARERPAAHLDAKILTAARDAAIPRQARVRSWTRPLAWAATIGLSLAIVLQVTEQPVVEIPAEVQPATTAEPASASASASASAPAKRQDMDITQETAKQAAAPDAVSESVQSEIVQDAFTADMEMLREAEDMGRMRNNRSQLGAQPEAAALEPAADAITAFCNETARASAETWLACIAKLEDEQDHEAARLEQAAFDAVFGEPEQP